MSEQPMAYIIAALAIVGITCRHLDIFYYDPAAFGNLVAKAQTSIGQLDIIYDRGFVVDAQHADTTILAKIVEALEQQKRAANA